MHPNRIKLYAAARVAMPSCYMLRSGTDATGGCWVIAEPDDRLRRSRPHAQSFFVIGLCEDNLRPRVIEQMVEKLVHLCPVL